MATDVLTNLALPKTNATLTLRLIKSFEFRTEKSLVLHGVNLETTSVGDLKERARQGEQCPGIWLDGRMYGTRADRSYPDATRVETIS